MMYNYNMGQSERHLKTESDSFHRSVVRPQWLVFRAPKLFKPIAVQRESSNRGQWAGQEERYSVLISHQEQGLHWAQW